MLTTSRVRKADQGDEAELVAMCHELHRENGIFSMSDDRVRDYLNRAFRKEGAIIGVIGSHGKLEGSIYLLLTTMWYTDDWHLGELWNFVRAPFRKSDNAKQLLDFAKRCVDEINIAGVIGIISNDRTAAKVKLYERQFGKPAGAFFVYQPAALRQSVQTATIA
jgi:hypothetical protein